MTDRACDATPFDDDTCPALAALNDASLSKVSECFGRPCDQISELSRGGAVQPNVWIATMESRGGSGPVVEARLLWGKDVLAIRHLRAGGAVSIADFDLPGIDDGALVVARDGALLLPTGARVPEGFAVKLRCGRATVVLALVDDDAPRIPRVTRSRMIASSVAIVAVLNVLVAGLFFERRAAERPHVSTLTMSPPPIAIELGALREATVVTPSAPPLPEPVVIDVTVPRRVTPAQPETFGLVAIVTADPARGASPFERAIDVDAINRLFTPSIDAVATPLLSRTSL